MSCYHPLVGVWTGSYTDRGKKKYDIRSNKCYEEVSKSGEDFVLLPCGHCIGCRLDYSRSWADRMMLELETAKKAVFLTLTYDQLHAHPVEYQEAVPPDVFFPNSRIQDVIEDGHYFVPVSYDLDYTDVQRFLKLLRKDYPPGTLRFYCGSEYGELRGRPHFHMILYGISLDDLKDKIFWGKNKFGDKLYVSPYLNGKWKQGRVIIGNVTWKTCAYVARYVTKKAMGKESILYDARFQSPEFARMSRKPGIGMKYLEQHPDCLDKQEIYLSTPEGSLKVSIPKYFMDQMDIEVKNKEKNPLYNPEKYDSIKSMRKEFASDKMLLELQQTGLGFLDYLEVKENNKKNRTKIFKRDSVEQ